MWFQTVERSSCLLPQPLRKMWPRTIERSKCLLPRPLETVSDVHVFALTREQRGAGNSAIPSRLPEDKFECVGVAPNDREKQMPPAPTVGEGVPEWMMVSVMGGVDWKVKCDIRRLREATASCPNR